MDAKKPSTRLFVLIARRADVAVVFRRGPSRYVLLVRWDLAHDTFEAGQWLKHRVYERRCDLSPNGERLIYFAASHHGPLQTWTAVSRPPYFTALALWPKGDAWGGGGLFADDDRIRLNHPPSALALAEGFQIPDHIEVSRLPYGGGGEDGPISSDRMGRDGWRLRQEGTWHQQSPGARVWLTLDPPEVWSKPHPDTSANLALQMRTLGVHERQGPWYVTDYALTDRAGQVVADLGRTDWADWHSSGDLLFARNGKIFRDGSVTQVTRHAHSSAREVIDLSDLRFVRREPVPLATEWTGPRPHGVPLSPAAR